MAVSKKNEGRISLALKPATARAMRQLAYLADQSVNDYIGTILDGVLERNADVLNEFWAAESKAKAAVKTFEE